MRLTVRDTDGGKTDTACHIVATRPVMRQLQDAELPRVYVRHPCDDCGVERGYLVSCSADATAPKPGR
jgi:hypothetical protein